MATPAMIKEDFSMQDTVLVGVHGSDCGRRAAEFAAGQAKLTQSHPVLAYAIEWSPYSFNTTEENELRHKRRQAAIKTTQQKILAPLLDSFK